MREIGTKKEGLLLVNKPRGITSHDVVDFVRKKFKLKKVGHTGTLDPEATGLLIVLVGRYTKLFPTFANFDKEYRGVMKLGEVTTTGDAEGEVIRRYSWKGLSEEKIRETFDSFKGEIEQVSPMVSARRVNGKRLYKLARKGVVVERSPRKVHIYDLKVTHIDRPYVHFDIKCSKGTYIRQLAEDIGERLGCGGHMVHIVRTVIGSYNCADAVNLEELSEEHLRAYPL